MLRLSTRHGIGEMDGTKVVYFAQNLGVLNLRQTNYIWRTSGRGSIAFSQCDIRSTFLSLREERLAHGCVCSRQCSYGPQYGLWLFKRAAWAVVEMDFVRLTDATKQIRPSNQRPLKLQRNANIMTASVSMER